MHTRLVTRKSNTITSSHIMIRSKLVFIWPMYLRETIIYFMIHRQFTNLYHLCVQSSRCRQRNCKQRTLDKLETKDIILNSSHPYTIEVLYCTTLGVLLDALGLLTLNHKSYVSFVRSNFESSRKCFHNVIHRGVSCIHHLYLTVPFQYDSLRAHTSLTVTKNNFKVQNI